MQAALTAAQCIRKPLRTRAVSMFIEHLESVHWSCRTACQRTFRASSGMSLHFESGIATEEYSSTNTEGNFPMRTTEMIYELSLPVQQYSITCLDCGKRLSRRRVPRPTREFLSDTLVGEGTGVPLQVGVGYTSREVCDGQGLCSPGRWAPANRRYPAGPRWEPVAKLFMDFARSYGTTDVLSRLALGKFLPRLSCRKESRS